VKSPPSFGQLDGTTFQLSMKNRDAAAESRRFYRPVSGREFAISKLCIWRFDPLHPSQSVPAPQGITKP